MTHRLGTDDSAKTAHGVGWGAGHPIGIIPISAGVGHPPTGQETPLP